MHNNIEQAFSEGYPVERKKEGHVFDVQVAGQEDAERIASLYHEVAVNEMGWPADDLINNRVNGADATTRDLVAFEAGEIVGASRLVLSRPFPVEIAFPEVISTLNRDEASGAIVEVALTAVRKSSRGDQGVMLALYRKLYQWSIENSIQAWYSLQEKPITRLYQRLGLPFKELAEGRDYWCGITYPCRLDLAEAEQTVQTKNPKLWKFFQEGQP